MRKLFEDAMKEYKSDKTNYSAKMEDIYKKIKVVRGLIKLKKYSMAKSDLDKVKQELNALKRSGYNTKAVALYLSWVDEFEEKIKEGIRGY